MSTTPTGPIENTMDFVVDVSCDAIVENISSTQTQETGSEKIDNDITDLQTAWTSSTSGIPSLKLDGSTNTNKRSFYYILENDVNNSADVTTFIKMYMDTTKANYANQFSLQLVNDVISKIQQEFPNTSSTNNASLDLATCNSFNTYISSNSTNETQPEQTTARTYTTMLQQCQSANSQLAGIGDLGTDCDSSIIALISQQM